MTIEQFIKECDLKMTCEKIEDNPDLFDSLTWKWHKWNEKFTHYKCVIKNGRKRMSLYYSTLPTNTEPPRLSEVLEDLSLDAKDVTNKSFESFCFDLGYSTDSRKTEKNYKLCLKRTNKLKKLLGDDFQRLLILRDRSTTK